MHRPLVPTAAYYLAVVLSAWYGGRGPGLLATALAVLGSGWLFVPPLFSFNLGVQGLSELVAFTASALIIGFLTTTQRRACTAQPRVCERSDSRKKDTGGGPPDRAGPARL